jgi:hypothetical protein
MNINKSQRDFAKDREICEAATPGPWMNDNLSNSLIWGPKGPGFGLIAKANYGILWRDNARFIAEARTGWPAALDEIERLRAALEQALRQWQMYADQERGGELDYIADSKDPDDLEAQEYQRIMSMLQALSTTTDKGVERVKINYCMECDSNTSNNDFCSVCGSKHIIPGINAPEKEESNYEHD